MQCFETNAKINCERGIIRFLMVRLFEDGCDGEINKGEVVFF